MQRVLLYILKIVLLTLSQTVILIIEAQSNTGFIELSAGKTVFE